MGRSDESDAQKAMGKRQRGEAEREVLWCFNCGKRGHVAMRCPDQALFCGDGSQTGLGRGVAITANLLDVPELTELLKSVTMKQAQSGDASVVVT